MKYLCLVYLEEAKLHAVRDSECLAASERLRAEGRVVAADALHPVHTATTLRLRAGPLPPRPLPTMRSADVNTATLTTSSLSSRSTSVRPRPPLPCSFSSSSAKTRRRPVSVRQATRAALA